MVNIRPEGLDIVVFVCVEKRQSSGEIARVPQATAFITVIKSDPDWTGYIVTAAHVLEGVGNQPFYLRFNTSTGFDDVETLRDEWFIHDRADVAIIRVQWSTYTLHSVYPEQFIDADYYLNVQKMREAGLIQLPGIVSESAIQIETGNDVSIIGLFAQHYGVSKSLPVARSGTIARMPSEPVEFAHPGGAYSKAIGYLVEFRSWGGQSGSPVLVHRQLLNLVQVQVHTGPAGDGESGPQTVWVQSPRSEAFGLLGLVSGHFDIKQQAQTTGEISGSITTAINSGIAIVTPAEAIHELLWRDDVVADRQRALDDAAQARAQGNKYATPAPRRILQSDATE